MIATTIEQSKHLLGLGLDSNSADMFWMDTNSVSPCLKLIDDGIYNHRNYLIRFPNSSLPAWSLSALLEVMPKRFDTKCVKLQRGLLSDKWFCEYENMKYFAMGSSIDAVYEMVCWLLEQGLIKKGDNDES